MDYKQRSREEITNDFQIKDSKSLEGLHAAFSKLSLEVLLDCRDALNLLTEQSKKQRVEKVKVCKTCNGNKCITRTYYIEDESMGGAKLRAVYDCILCPDCTPNPQN